MPNTPVPAAGEAMPAAIDRSFPGVFVHFEQEPLNRRALLTGTAATAAALAATSLPADASENPIRALFEEWERIAGSLRDEDRFLTLNPDASNAEMDRLCGRQHELLLQMVKLPCLDTGDFAMKVIVVTGDGEFALDDFAPGILADARAVLAGDVS